MSCRDEVSEYFIEKNEKMGVIESQINLTARSDQFPHTLSCNTIPRSLSASVSIKFQDRNSVESSRPKSAESWNLIPNYNSSSLYSPNRNGNKLNDSSSSALSYFTDSSSKLLLHLLKMPEENEVENRKTIFESDFKYFDNYKRSNPDLTKPVSGNHCSYSVVSDYRNYNSKELYSKNICISEKKKESSEITKGLEEGKLISFFDNEFNTTEAFSRIKRSPHKCRIEDKKKFQVNEHNMNFFQKSQACRRVVLDNERSNIENSDHIEQEFPTNDVFKSKNQIEMLKIEKFNESSQSERNSVDQEEISSNHSSSKGKSKNSSKSPISNSVAEIQPVSQILILKKENQEKSCTMDRSYNKLASDSSEVTDQGLENSPKSAEFHDTDSTYDEIIQLLKRLEEEKIENDIFKMKVNPDGRSQLPEEVPKDTIDNINEVFAYLEEVEKDDTFHQTEKVLTNFTSPSLEKLLSKTSVELAHEVLSLEIQIEEQKKGIKLLKDTITEMKEAKRISEYENLETLHKTSSEAEALVKRHQKFIKQLLNEKKNLSETVSKLVQDLKLNEEKYKTNMRAMEEKHLIDVKKAKETQACADKIKREKWMEIKTQKIKEMTIKGLEPELTRMAAQQQQELTELRNLHRAEIEAMELKAARRTSELMDQLRTELTKEKENAITDKMNSLRASMEREFEEERNKFHQNCQNLKQRIRKLEEKLSNQETEYHFSLMETKQEMEKEKQKLIRIHEESLEDVKRRHLIELNNLRETLEAEKQLCLKNQEKHLSAKFLDKETELHDQYKRERDREIEMVIETFEKEQVKIQEELEIAKENKLKRVKEKLEAEIKELEKNENDLKVKLSCAKSEILEKEESITQLNSQIRQLETEMSFLRKSCENMISERTELKQTIRAEFESSINEMEKENRNLQKEILDLKEMYLKELAKKDQLNLQAKNEMQKELASVYSRIKIAISKKEKVIEALREENKAINERYRQLEMMMEKQRRNLLLQ